MEESLQTVVLKFGGAALETLEHFKKIAEIVKERAKTCSRIVVVVSAMKGETDKLIGMAKSVSKMPHLREQSILMSAGEQISAALLAMALLDIGQAAIALTGIQAGIITTADYVKAKINTIDTRKILEHLGENKVVVVAGFQGVSPSGEITTLERGGSDISAIALAIVLKAAKVELFKDVPGIYSADPKLDVSATLYPYLSYASALKVLEVGGQVVNFQGFIMARDHNIPLHILSYNDPLNVGTIIADALQDISFEKTIQHSIY